MLPAVTSMQATDIKIEWLAPNSGALEIERYLIEILTTDGVTYYEASSCDGSDAYIMANLFCTVSMDTFINDPFNLS